MGAISAPVGLLPPLLLLATFALVSGCATNALPATPVGAIAAPTLSNAFPIADAIVLPHDEPEMPPGPGQSTFMTACVTCHTTRYVTMQPLFPRKVWNTEVHKMIKVFGAHITPAEADTVVGYLTAVHGVPDKKDKNGGTSPTGAPPTVVPARGKGGGNGSATVS